MKSKLIGYLFLSIICATTYAQESCEIQDPLKITVMGSSVAKGQGGSGFGYARRFTDMLTKRFDDGIGKEWTIANISVGGDNTTKILNRWTNDLLPECGSYVIYGLSLANEGIQTGGEPIFNQFRDNMLKLVDMARENGVEPIVVGNYSRGNYSPSDYNFIKSINLLIHQWDVASINVLGAVDDGFGIWAPGHAADLGHPNQVGHQEFSFTIVPSLFDAIDQGKAMPIWQEGTSLEITPGKQLTVVPEEILHPFTYSFSVKTQGDGVLALFNVNNQELPGYLAINRSSGALQYTTPSNKTIIGTAKINDNNWHRVSITHYYALGKTLVYLDDRKQGEINEKIAPTTFYLSDKSAPKDVVFSNLLLYRSGMNIDEIEALNDGVMLKSSLEIYAPLDGTKPTVEERLANRARSQNMVKEVDAVNLLPLSITRRKVNHMELKVFPNPTNGDLHFDYILKRNSKVRINIFDGQGRLIDFVHKNALAGKHRLDWYARSETSLRNGLYFYTFESEEGYDQGQFLIQ